jgi:hypothetical protein
MTPSSGLKNITKQEGRAIPQEVIRWLPTSAARVRAWVWSCGICGGQSGAGAGLLVVLRFPMPIIIPPIAPVTIIWGWYNGPVVVAASSGFSLTALTSKKKPSWSRLQGARRRGRHVCRKRQLTFNTLHKQTPWFQPAKRTIPTDRPPLVGEVSANFSG